MRGAVLSDSDKHAPPLSLRVGNVRRDGVLLYADIRLLHILHRRAARFVVAVVVCHSSRRSRRLEFSGAESRQLESTVDS